MRFLTAALAAMLGSTASAQTLEEAAKAFGARPAMSSTALSPDGTKIAFLAPGPMQASNLYVVETANGSAPRIVISTDEKADRILGCTWVSNERLACRTGGYVKIGTEVNGFRSAIAANADGSNIRLLTARRGENALYSDLNGGSIIDYVPGVDGAVLMARTYVPEEQIGSLITKTEQGLGVDQIDTRTLARKKIEPPRPNAIEYISDGRGDVRIAGFQTLTPSGYSGNVIEYRYRMNVDKDWKILASYDYLNETGLNPYAVDPGKNIAYGFRKIDGRKALVSVTLDGNLTETVLAKRDDVDVDGLITVGRQQRVVGASYATEKRQSVYFDPELKRLAASLGKALPKQPLIEFADANADESKLLIWAGGDTEPGTYYLFDKTAKKLQPIMQTRPLLSGIGLAVVKPVTYPARDGTMVPAYLTLPPGSTGKNLPAIVMPHGGPSARDEWGFDWLPQFYANRGFAVIQPNYRGSSGYGDAWFQDNGFKSWRTAIGDVADAGKWLVSQGIANAAQLNIVGWSYGGYAALQSAVVEPGLFKKVVAIAPVTDLAETKSEWRNYSNRRVQEKFIGSGPHIVEGSPAQNASAITAPVLMFHGDFDRNVGIGQSRLMVSKLKSAGKQVTLVEYPGLDHSLVDSVARADMLKKSAEFLLR